MGFDLNVSVPVLTVFLQGILSFFSPCVLPLIPLYMGYLSGGTVHRNEDGTIVYNQKKVILHTICFVIGVSFAFFILGLGFSAMGQFLKSNQLLIARIGGVLVILFGLYQLGLFGNPQFMEKDRRLPLHMEKLAMSPLVALVMGFTFSFAWTPCVGPALASVLLMTASAGSQRTGFLLIGVYTLGFVLPFLAVGFFTTKLLGVFRKHNKIVKYTVKIGGVLMLLMGFLMLTGQMNSLTGYLSGISGNQAEAENAETESTAEVDSEQKATVDTNQKEVDSAAAAEENEEKSDQNTEEKEQAQRKIHPALDFTLTDQYGETHTLSDYKGKTVFLNFWATWCPPCRAEMPDIQKLYENYDRDGDEALIVLGIAAPGYGSEGSEEEVKAFLEENGYTYPVLMDSEAKQFMRYGINAYPTTFMIDRDGNIFGYVTGQLSEETMERIIRQTMTGKKE